MWLETFIASTGRNEIGIFIVFFIVILNKIYENKFFQLVAELFHSRAP